ncbi:hypothetical protein HY640_02240 [Candidatus Woesearchaeota archaeon]|nr:hypothetical protein [Candidatus Woesearchaeota archaeon]
MQKKLRVGWFSFSCCEDSTILFVELMNERFLDWKRLIDFRHARVLQGRNFDDYLDVAFVEGAIATERDADELVRIRSRSKRLVAIGACACEGMPSGQRNEFDEEKKREIQFLVDRFRLCERVRKVSDIVVVDSLVPGCPMVEQAFLDVLDKYLMEFGVVHA